MSAELERYVVIACDVPQAATYGIIGTVTWGCVAMVVSAAVFVAASVGVRSGHAPGLWSGLLALSGAGVAAAGLLVQGDADTASWIVAPPVGAVLAVVHARALFATGGPFRT